MSSAPNGRGLGRHRRGGRRRGLRFGHRGRRRQRSGACQSRRSPRQDRGSGRRSRRSTIGSGPQGSGQLGQCAGGRGTRRDGRGGRRSHPRPRPFAAAYESAGENQFGRGVGQTRAGRHRRGGSTRTCHARREQRSSCRSSPRVGHGWPTHRGIRSGCHHGSRRPRSSSPGRCGGGIRYLGRSRRSDPRSTSRALRRCQRRRESPSRTRAAKTCRRHTRGRRGFDAATDGRR